MISSTIIRPSDLLKFRINFWNWIFQTFGRCPCIVGLALLSTSYYAPLHREKNVATHSCLVWKPI